MKLERRGKYPGVKVHLDDEECKRLIKFAEETDAPSAVFRSAFAAKLGRKITQLHIEDPTIIMERTPDQIREVLEGELQAATLKLEAIKQGEDWKKHSSGAKEH